MTFEEPKKAPEKAGRMRIGGIFFDHFIRNGNDVKAAANSTVKELGLPPDEEKKLIERSSELLAIGRGAQQNEAFLNRTSEYDKDRAA